MSDQVLSQILNQLQQMDKRFDHIDGRLEKIEDRLGTLDSRLDTMDGRLDTMDGRLDTMDTRLDAIEEQTKTIPLLQQAVLETLEVTKRLEASQITFERKVTAELNTHQHSIDILNRRQLRMEADIEALKHS
jgi:chromosome segregation ATPase